MGGTSTGTGITIDLLGLLNQLLPGLLAAAIFYSLTAFQRPSPFERVVQALIFTMIVRVAAITVKYAAITIGKFCKPFFDWNTDSDLIWSFVLAVAVGFLSSVIANKNWIHRVLREEFNVTNRESYPSEWYGIHKHACHYQSRDAILHLVDGRRIRGQVENWPDEPTNGIYSLGNAAWLEQGKDDQKLEAIWRIVIHATDVKMVEFMILNDEYSEIQNTIAMQGGDIDVI